MACGKAASEPAAVDRPRLWADEGRGDASLFALRGAASLGASLFVGLYPGVSRTRCQRFPSSSFQTAARIAPQARKRSSGQMWLERRRQLNQLINFSESVDDLINLNYDGKW